jgi:hypothetical protein
VPCLLRLLLGLPAQPPGGRQHHGVPLLACLDVSTPAAATAYLSIISSVQVGGWSSGACGGCLRVQAGLCCTDQRPHVATVLRCCDRAKRAQGMSFATVHMPVYLQPCTLVHPCESMLPTRFAVWHSSSSSNSGGSSSSSSSSDAPCPLPPQVKAAAALANLSSHRQGLEALVVEKTSTVPVLRGLVRILHLTTPPPAPPPAAGPGTTPFDAPPPPTNGSKTYSRGGVYGLSAQYRTYMLLMLSNILSHPVLAKAFCSSQPAVQQLFDLVLAIPKPSQQPTGELSRSQPGMQVPIPPGTPAAPPAAVDLATSNLATNSLLEAVKQLLGSCPQPGMAALGQHTLHSLALHMVDMMDWSSVAREMPGMDVRHLIATAGQAAGVVGQLAINGLPDSLLTQVRAAAGTPVCWPWCVCREQACATHDVWQCCSPLPGCLAAVGASCRPAAVLVTCLARARTDGGCRSWLLAAPTHVPSCTHMPSCVTDDLTAQHSHSLLTAPSLPQSETLLERLHKLLLLPTLDTLPQGFADIAASAAGQAAGAVWALSSNPTGRPWAEKVAQGGGPACQCGACQDRLALVHLLPPAATCYHLLPPAARTAWPSCTCCHYVAYTSAASSALTSTCHHASPPATHAYRSRNGTTQ